MKKSKDGAQLWLMVWALGLAGQLGAALAVQPVIGTIAGTVVGGILVGACDHYMRLFVVMGAQALLTRKGTPATR